MTLVRCLVPVTLGPQNTTKGDPVESVTILKQYCMYPKPMQKLTELWTNPENTHTRVEDPKTVFSKVVHCSPRVKMGWVG